MTKGMYGKKDIRKDGLLKIKKLKEREPTPPVDIKAIRTAVADYMDSEGCSCCRGSDHDEHREILGKMLKVRRYSDGSGRDFSLYRSKK